MRQRVKGVVLRPPRVAGFSLPETLVAALVFAVLLCGLLQYHQVLVQSLVHQMQQRQAWRFAHQQLDAEERPELAQTFALPPGWRISRIEQNHPPVCRSVTVTIETPYRYQASLERWFCHNPLDTVTSTASRYTA
ncbi:MULTISPECIES: prepilin-type N-terminal cleavage/methylation domain-containing protein [Dickeya]|uniref:prepilin-type N-terminal cleavage/methylation domain-containing protein n=1 Tax=Dickeya TaxID=204037 RepID=UPI001E3B3EC9|nr:MULTISPECIES: prepilin-type N-terminal cleavage/methylation domain-containing protein [Dickeya]